MENHKAVFSALIRSLTSSVWISRRHAPHLFLHISRDGYKGLRNPGKGFSRNMPVQAIPDELECSDAVDRIDDDCHVTDRNRQNKQRIKQMDSCKARNAMAKRYEVSPDDLAIGPVWDVPEVGKRFLMFEIMDPNHLLFKSTLCYDISLSAMAEGGIDPQNRDF